MTSLQDLDIFVRTADAGSLSAAARALDLTPAAASAALKRLETELGVQLFVRSTRSLRLTQPGEQFLEQCRPALATLQQASMGLVDGTSAFSGVLKISAPSDFGRNVLLPLLQIFQARHPGVELRLLLADRQANVYSEPVDVAFRFGKPVDSELVALPLDPHNRRVLCAAPSYLERHGRPKHPRDLLEHQCLCFMLGDEVHDRWRFTRTGEAELVVKVKGANVANDGDVVRRWAVLGQGIAYKSRTDVAEDLAQGRLVVLCEDWTTEASPLFLVVPDRRHVTPLVRGLREFMVERLVNAS
ncbi:LysR family transcriptional regulator [Pelomonas sp. KK5]|uniref:LysR family transcriptional regulator n=1 Tax=Pelomonas sp. KK5 TaxID=1855730 RepID=UPI00097BD955|nr:LysR family transcriptional regulator [Pelomonas sp. KK5]